MVPHAIRNNLASLRRRERFLVFIWGFACWLSITLVLLMLCGFVDWLIDRQRDTPLSVLQAMLAVQVVVAAASGLWFLFWPQLRRLPDSMLALWVEAKLSHFGHRLISAVQLNQPGARVDGMSPELITIVTSDAEKEARKVGFAQVADHARLKWGVMVLFPVLVIVAIPFLIWPDLCFALLSRQALNPVEIPHSVNLDSITVNVWKKNEKIPIRYRVTGQFNKDMVGTVYVTPDGQPTDSYDLVYITEDERGAIFGVDVQESSVNVTYSARLDDGRTRFPSEVVLIARPSIVDNQTFAWIQLPWYCGKGPKDKPRPDDKRFERLQEPGKVVGIPGARVRVELKTLNPIKVATLELLQADSVDGNPTEDEASRKEKTKEWLEMKLSKDGVTAGCEFDLVKGLTGYRLHVKDENGFENLAPPRWSLGLVDEAKPEVKLRRDSVFDKSDYDAGFDFEGMPVVLGNRIRIPYVCYGPYGLGKAALMYRLLKKHDSSAEAVQEEDWTTMDLPEDPDAGPYNPKTGVFANKKWDKQVLFYVAPSTQPDEQLPRSYGGGRVFLETKNLFFKTKTGNPVVLKSGDQIEYYVEVFASPREPEASIPRATSEIRVTTLVTGKEWGAWLRQLADEDRRLRDLKTLEENIFQAR